MRRHHLVGARRLCTTLPGHRVRKWNARNLITRPITDMARHRTLRRATASASEDALKSVYSWLTEKKFRDAECADITYVGARRPCMAFLGRRVRE